MYAITLSWEQSNNALMWAIENQAPLRLTVHLARDWMEVSSQFIGGEMLKSLLVKSFPEPWTNKVLAGQLLPCSFRKGHRKYLFVSAIASHEQVEFAGAASQTCVLAWPDGLQEMQRRHYVRAKVPEEYDLAVRLWLPVPAVEQRPMTEPFAVGKLIDISAGGALVELGTAENIRVGDSYLLEIELPKPEEPVLVLAQSRRMEGGPDQTLGHYGFQLLSPGCGPRGQQTLFRLARFANYLRQFGSLERSCTVQ